MVRRMEEIEGVNCGESKSSIEGRPPNPPSSAAAAYRQSQRTDPLVLPCKKSLVRHPSLVSLFFLFFFFCFNCKRAFIVLMVFEC